MPADLEVSVDEFDKEKWRWVVGYERLYKVSNHGRIKSVGRFTTGRIKKRWFIKSRILTAHPNGDNHLHKVTLSKRNKSRTYYVHRLVLEAFVGPCPTGLQACHFPDKRYSNNRIDNLRWDTRSANAQDRKFHGTYYLEDKSPSAKLTNEQVRKIKRRFKIKGYTRKRALFLSKRYNVSIYAVKRIYKGQSWKTILC